MFPAQAFPALRSSRIRLWEAFGELVGSFQGYPRDTLVRKLKYRWLLNAYWSIDVYPNHPSRDEDVLPATTSICNTINEWLRLFYLVRHWSQLFIGKVSYCCLQHFLLFCKCEIHNSPSIGLFFCYIITQIA